MTTVTIRDLQTGKPVQCEALYVSPSGILAVLPDGRGYSVWHIASGLKVPHHTYLGGRRGQYPADTAAYSATAFRLKTAARNYMLAVEGTGLLTADVEQDAERVRKLREWLIATYPAIQREGAR